VGTGFDENFLRKLYRKLSGMKVKRPVFRDVEIPADREIVWVKPRIVCEVKYLELSERGIMRAPSFRRIRFDKKPSECVLE